MYTAEIAPAALRGALVNLYQLAIATGILYSQLSNLAFARAAWRTPVALAAAPALVMVGAVWFFVPESDVWLSTTSSVYNTISEGAEEDTSNDSAPSLQTLLYDASARRRLAIGAGLCAAQQWSGFIAVIFYAPTLVADALGWTSGAEDSLRVTVGLGVVLVVMTVVTVAVSDRVGRRPLLLLGGPLMAFALIVLGALRIGLLPKRVALVLGSLVGYVAAFALSYGALPFVVAAEIFPPRYKASGMSICTFVLGLSAVVVGFTFLPLLNLVSGLVYVMYAVFLLASTCFVWMLVPETKNMSLEEIDVLLRT